MQNKYKSRLIIICTIIFIISYNNVHAQLFKSAIFNLQPQSRLHFYKSFLNGDSISTIGSFEKFYDFKRRGIQVLKIDTSLNIGTNYTVEKAGIPNTLNFIKSGENYYHRAILFDNELIKIDSNYILQVNEQTGKTTSKKLDINDNFIIDYRITNYNNKIKLSYKGHLHGHYGLIINTYDMDLNCMDTILTNNGYIHNNENLIFSEDNLYLIINKSTILDDVHCDGKFLAKFDKDLNLIWEKPIFYDKFGYKSQGNLFFWGEKICYIVQTTRNLEPNSHARSMKFALIDTEGEIEWQFGIDAALNDYLTAWKILSNGDLLVGGSCYNSSSGFNDARLLKISQKDALLWDRFYTDKEHFEFRESAFFTIEELPDGNIIAIGSFANKKNISAEPMGWAVKLDQNGCPGYDCGNMVTDYSLDSKSINKSLKMSVNPNPGNNEIKITYDKIGSMTGDLLIYDSYGNILIKKTYTSSDVNFDVSKLQTGTYFIKFISDKNSYVAKWLKM